MSHLLYIESGTLFVSGVSGASPFFPQARSHDTNLEQQAAFSEAKTERHIAAIREAAPNLPFLIPGIGAQGGDLEASIRAAKNDRPDRGFIINASRSILYASSEDDYLDAALKAAEQLRASIEETLSKIDSEGGD